MDFDIDFELLLILYAKYHKQTIEEEEKVDIGKKFFPPKKKKQPWEPLLGTEGWSFHPAKKQEITIETVVVVE